MPRMLNGRGTFSGRTSVSRRTVLRGSALGFTGLAGAALLGCSSSDGDGGVTATATSSGGSSSATTTSGAPPAEVRLAPGRYEGVLAPTVAEQDPLANGRYGGTLYTRYLDPPHMDFNQTLSCTINTTMDYTKNKLTRAMLNAKSDPNKIDVEGDLAESWEVSDDAMKFTFTLRPAKFHNVAPTNGRAMTSEDVKLSFERYQAGGTQRDMFSEVTSIETPDDKTVVVNLGQPVVEFPRNIAAWSHIDARELIEDQEFLKEHAIGTGPFIQQDWIRKESTHFVRNPDYFEEGLPFLDGVVARVFNDTASQRAGFLTHHLADFGARDEDDAADLRNDVDDAIHLVGERLQGANSMVMVFQMKNPAMQDERVRRAISMAVDRREYSLSRSYAGDGFPYPALGWQPIFDQRPTLEDCGPWYQFNQAEASKMLQAAGYSSDSPFEFEVTQYYLQAFYQFDDLVLPMLNQLPELKVSSRSVDNPTSVVMLNNREFESAHGMTFGPPAYSVDQIAFPFMHSTGGANFGSIDDPDLDALIEAQRREPDDDARRDLWKQIWDIDLEQVYYMYLPENAARHSMWHNYMLNFRPHGLGGFTCYGNGIARSVWLDEGAPTPG